MQASCVAMATVMAVGSTALHVGKMKADWSHGARLRLGALLISFAAGAVVDVGAQQRPCESIGAPPGPSRDLYCIELVPAPGLEQLRGHCGAVVRRHSIHDRGDA